MALALSLLLAAVGATLVWGVNASVAGVDLDVVGWILLVVGVIGTFLSLILWAPWTRDHPERRERVVVD